MLLGVETVNVLVCGVPQVKETELGAKVNVGVGLFIEMLRGVPSKN